MCIEKKKKSGRVIVIVKKWQGHKSEMQERGGELPREERRLPIVFFFLIFRERGGRLKRSFHEYPRFRRIGLYNIKKAPSGSPKTFFKSSMVYLQAV